MNKGRISIFFVLVALVILASMKVGDRQLVDKLITKLPGKNSPVKKVVTTGIICIVIAGLLFTLYFFMGAGDCNENFWDVTDYALCKGGPYMWQGDSATSEMCRAMAKTPEGKCGIASYNCGTGYIGTPAIPYVYSPISDDKWHNTRCTELPDCPCKTCGFTASERQVPFLLA